MNPRDDDTGDAPRDEHLRAALRHAPDHGLSAPAHVSHAILSAARQVHRPVRAAPVAEPAPPRVVPERHVPLRVRLQALLAPRWAGSIAAGMVAALVVGLWYGEDLPSPLREERAAESEATKPAAPEAASTPAAGVAQPSQPTATGAAGGAAAPTEQTKATSPPPPAPRPRAAAKQAAPPPVAQETPPAVVREAAPPVLGKAPASPSAADEQAGRDTPAAKSDGALRASPPAAAATSSSEAHGSGVMALQAPAAPSPALTLLRRVRSDGDAHGAIWTWQIDPGTSARSFDADGQAWLARLVYAARGRWADVAERNDGGSAAELRWWRNDEPAALLRIEEQGLRWIEPSQRIRFAPMTADELARLAPPR
ncbi:MAG: hypothetical protein U1E89_09020 [Burkholderiaceae bacterium]